MLILLGYVNKYDRNKISYERQVLQTCLTSSYYFILDDTNKVLYYYNYKYVYNNFFINGIDILGFTDEKIVDTLEENTNFKFYLNDDIIEVQISEPLKIVVGDSIDRKLNIKYNSLLYEINDSYTDASREIFSDTHISLIDILYMFRDNCIKIPTSYISMYLNRNIQTCSEDVQLLDIFRFLDINSVTTYKNLFGLLTKEKELDLRDLRCDDVIDCSTMFIGCISLERLYFCKLNINKPIKLTDCFKTCTHLNLIDFSSLQGDYPNVDMQERTTLCSLLYLGLTKDYKGPYRIIVLSNETPVFNDCLILRNSLFYLGKVTGPNYLEKLDILRAKLALKGAKYNDVFYVLKD